MTDQKKQDVIKEKILTYDVYAKIDDGDRYELVDGVLELRSHFTYIPASTNK